MRITACTCLGWFGQWLGVKREEEYFEENNWKLTMVGDKGIPENWETIDVDAAVVFDD